MQFDLTTLYPQQVHCTINLKMSPIVFIEELFSGHAMFLKNHKVQGNQVTGQLVSLGGTKMEDGRTWNHSRDLMSRTFEITDASAELGKLSTLKSFQVTSSHKNRTCSGSTTPRLMNASYVDLEGPESGILKAVLYGGQSVDTGLTSDYIIMIEGVLESDISKCNMDVTIYPASHTHYYEFGVPEGWPDGSHLVQLGNVPEGRTGSGLSILRHVGSAVQLVSIGGHTRDDFMTSSHHPEAAMNLLLVPEMRWWKISQDDLLRRSFHSQTIHSDGTIYVLGGMSMKDGRWSKIHPLTELVKIQIKEDFSYSLEVVQLDMSIETCSHITNFSYCGIGNNIFIFSGFKFPEYSSDEENLYQFQPPVANKNKLPRFSDQIFKIDLERKKVSSYLSMKDCGGYGGSVVCISGQSDGPLELIINIDPKILLHSERIFDSPECDLPEEFGSCSLSIVEKKRDHYICATPICGRKVHFKCDKSIRTKPAVHQFCPVCRHLDPTTWKPLPGTSKPRWRRN